MGGTGGAPRMPTTSGLEYRAVRSSRFSSKALALAAALSLITSPLTAVWFLLLGPVVMMLSAIVAAVARTSVDQRERVLRVGSSVGVGLLAGPLLYIALALAH
jgi:hypothetical protein